MPIDIHPNTCKQTVICKISVHNIIKTVSMVCPLGSAVVLLATFRLFYLPLYLPLHFGSHFYLLLPFPCTPFVLSYLSTLSFLFHLFLFWLLLPTFCLPAWPKETVRLVRLRAHISEERFNLCSPCTCT